MEPSLLAIRQSFDDIQDMVSEGPLLRMDYAQLDRGRFAGSRIGIPLPTGRFWRSQGSLACYGVGEMLPGLLMVALVGPDTHFDFFHGRSLNHNSLALGNYQTGIDHRTGVRSETYMWMFPVARYFEVAESLKVDLPNGLDKVTPVLELDSPQIYRLREIVRRGVQTLDCRPVRFWEVREFEEHLLTATVQCLNPNARFEDNRTPEVGGIFARARGWLHDHRRSRVSLSELCREIGVEERTLRNHFERGVGMGPIDYHLTFRLNQVRSALLQAKSERGAVSRIAREFGFSHMGRFGQQFRALFGEAPGETLSGPNSRAR